MSLSIEQRLTQHELADERRFGQLETHLTRIEGKIDLLGAQVLEARSRADSATDMAEETGRHHTLDAEKRADFWKKLISGVLATLMVSSITALVTYFVTHRG